MFARTAFRTLQAASAPIKMAPARRYATTPAGGSSNNTAIIAAAALAAGAGSYYVLSSSSSGAAKKADAASAQSAEPASAASSAAATAAVKEAFTGGAQGFVPLTVENVDTVNHNTKLVRFKLPEADQVSGMQAASALLTKFKPEGAEKPVIRPYTAVSDDDAKGHLDLLVKRYEGGAMSNHIHSLKPGDTLDIKGPIVKYKWAPNKHEEIALVAGGTGITPMYQLIKAIFQNPAAVAAGEKTKVTLVYGNISEQDILLHKELRDIENKFPQRFRAFYVLEKPEDEKNFQGTKGYITKDLLKQVLPEPKEGSDSIKIFVCGPPGLMNAISGSKKSPSDQGDLSGALKELGYSKDQVLKL